MSKFADLLKADKDYAAKQEKAQARKADPFAALGKAVASAGSSVSNATAAEGESVVPPKTTQSPSALFSFLGKEKKTSPDVSTQPESPAAANASLATGDITPPDTTMQGISGGSFSETKSAMEFQAKDQPDGYNAELVNGLKDSLDILINSIDNKELVGDALKRIMLDLKRYPFLVDIMHPEDCQLMVRAVRESYGVTLAKKQTRSTKKAATSKEVEDVLEILGDVEINI